MARTSRKPDEDSVKALVPSGVHPLAALFPMMPDDELRELAEDIAANGQRHPILIDAQGRLLDGRNRYRACELVEVEPWLARFEGDEAAAVALILSENVTRRHLSKQQRAMALALAELDRNENNEIDLEENGTGTSGPGCGTQPLSKFVLSEARMIASYSRTTGEKLLAGAPDVIWAKELDDARLAKQRRKARLAAIEELRAEFPDLAEQVEANYLSLEDAQADANNRRQRERAVRSGIVTTCRQMTSLLQTFAAPTFVEGSVNPRIAINPDDEEKAEKARAFRAQISEAIDLDRLTADDLSRFEVGFDTFLELIEELRKGGE